MICMTMVALLCRGREREGGKEGKNREKKQHGSHIEKVLSKINFAGVISN